MKCPRCGNDSPGEALFCGRCGANMEEEIQKRLIGLRSQIDEEQKKNSTLKRQLQECENEIFQQGLKNLEEKRTQLLREVESLEDELSRGLRQNAPAVPVKISHLQSGPKKKFCTSCGAQIDGATYCGICGTKVN